MITDAHMHIHVPSEAPYPDMDELRLICTCTARREEWALLDDIADPRVRRYYGIHPWYCGEWDGECESDLRERLASDRKAGVGEIGLDSVRGGDIDLQTDVFMKQLAVAREADRPVTVHMVGTEKRVLDSLRASGISTPVILHSFKSESYARPFAELGCYFSVNPRLVAKDPQNVRRILDAIPAERLLVESDYPHCAKGFGGMGAFISALAGIMEISPEELSGITEHNLRTIA